MQNTTTTIQMLDGYRATHKNAHIKTTHEINLVSSQHRTEEGMLHRADGPALSSFKENYHEWWDDGRLVATFQKDKLNKSIDGAFTGLREVEVPVKWKGLESTLSLTDLNLCAFKQLEFKETSSKTVQANINNVRANSMQTEVANKLKIS